MPANLVNVEGAHQAYATTTVLDGVSLGLAAGDRVGVVGPNGAGKSTLIRLLAREIEPDAGRVTVAGGARVGLLAQGDDLPAAAAVLDTVVGAGPAHTWAGDARVRGILDGLLGGVEPTARLGTLSGGERRRVALARLLVAAPDVLLLDEPTNHLDLDGITWLARHLAGHRGALAVVTHDRWFLDEVATATWEVAGGAVHRYEGGYSAYVLARAERERLAAAADDKRRNLLRKELAWLRRGPPARTAKPRFRIDAANALIEGEPPPRDRAQLQRFATARLGRDVFELDQLTLTLGPRTLLAGVDLHIGPGDRLGLVGSNGSGKTSVLRLLAGELAPAGGRLRTGRTVRLAHLSQQPSELDPTRRVLQSVADVAERLSLPGGGELTAAQLAERFGFARERQWTPVGELSGGERRRVQLLRALMTEPNVLLLDEPTNDLDIETLTQLEDLLDGWPGTLVVASHDRYFLERVTDDVYALFGDGRLTHLPGGVEDYLQRRPATPPPPAPSAGGRRAGPSPDPDPSPDPRTARKELRRVERELARATRRRDELHARMADVASDFAALAELDGQLTVVNSVIAALEEQWLVLAESA